MSEGPIAIHQHPKGRAILSAICCRLKSGLVGRTGVVATALDAQCLYGARAVFSQRQWDILERIAFDPPSQLRPSRVRIPDMADLNRSRISARAAKRLDAELWRPS